MERCPKRPQPSQPSLPFPSPPHNVIRCPSDKLPKSSRLPANLSQQLPIATVLLFIYPAIALHILPISAPPLPTVPSPSKICQPLDYTIIAGRALRDTFYSIVLPPSAEFTCVPKPHGEIGNLRGWEKLKQPRLSFRVSPHP